MCVHVLTSGVNGRAVERHEAGRVDQALHTQWTALVRVARVLVQRPHTRRHCNSNVTTSALHHRVVTTGMPVLQMKM